jgi:hypothetical protein
MYTEEHQPAATNKPMMPKMTVFLFSLARMSDSQKSQGVEQGLSVLPKRIIELEVGLGCRDASSERRPDCVVDEGTNTVRAFRPVAWIHVQVAQATGMVEVAPNTKFKAPTCLGG